MKKEFLIFCMNVVFFVTGIAQNVEFTNENFPNQSKQLKEALKNIQLGDKQYAQKKENTLKYKQALDYYNQALIFNKDNAVLNLKIANCYYKMNNQDFAIRYGEYAYSLNPVDSNKALFFKGYAQQRNSKLEEAIQSFTTFAANPAITSGEEMAARQKIKECETGIMLMKKDVHCFIDNLDTIINKSVDEYLYIETKDSIVYFTQKATGNDATIREYIYTVNRNGLPVIFNEKLSKKYESLQTISKDGTYAIVYNSENDGDLYEVTIKNGQWLKPKNLKAINTKYHETSASLTANGDTLYFCSNRNDSYGEHDIYMSVRNKQGKWTKPQNLGAIINTPLNELSVYVDSNYLYFSSQGHQTMGGFDIFRSSFANGVWTTPENIGYPVNSVYDDIYFSISDDKKIAYFSSNRKDGQGGQDVYKITFLGEPKLFVFNTDNVRMSDHGFLQPYRVQIKELEKDKVTTVEGIVMDAKTKALLFTMIELSNIAENKLLATFLSDSVTGKYTLLLPSGTNYGISIKKDGYLYYSENFNIPESMESQVINQVILLNKIEVNQIITLKNIFFDVNKTTLKPESTTEIENAYKLMMENPTIQIEISGHTDSKGGSAFNKKLSQGRALAVVNALTAKGIEPNRMKSVGYGPDKPIAPNNTEAGRAQNRRIDFKIISK